MLATQSRKVYSYGYTVYTHAIKKQYNSPTVAIGAWLDD